MRLNNPSFLIKGISTIESTKSLVGCILVGSFFTLGFLYWRDRKRYVRSLENPTQKELETMSPKQVQTVISCHIGCYVYHGNDTYFKSCDGSFDASPHVPYTV